MSSDRIYIARLAMSVVKVTECRNACHGSLHPGFALPDNKDEVLMVKCPLPPVEQWDDVIRARMLFLLDRGLLPQLFLAARRLPDVAGNQVCSIQHMRDCSDAMRVISLEHEA